MCVIAVDGFSRHLIFERPHIVNEAEQLGVELVQRQLHNGNKKGRLMCARRSNGATKWGCPEFCEKRDRSGMPGFDAVCSDDEGNDFVAFCVYVDVRQDQVIVLRGRHDDRLLSNLDIVPCIDFGLMLSLENSCFPVAD